MTPSNDLLVLTSSGGKQLPPDVIHHIFGILEAQGACGTLAKIQSCSQVMYRGVNPYLYRHLYLLRSVFERLFGLIVDKGKLEDFNIPTQKPFDDTVRWMELPQVVRIRSLFTLVKKITLTFDYSYEDSPAIFTQISTILQSDEIEDGVILPNVVSIRFIGSRAFPMYPSKVTSLLGIISRPKHLCFNHLTAFAPLDDVHRAYDTKEIQTITVHQAHEHPVPSAGKHEVRMSYDARKCAEDCSNGSKESGKWCPNCEGTLAKRRMYFGALLNHVQVEELQSPCPAWKIIAGDGIHKENAEGIKCVVEEYQKDIKLRLQNAKRATWEAHEGDEPDDVNSVTEMDDGR
ncbi:hypothetical protein I302_105856 [Kwoniella bestiolae CBS 10118]|uniref:F-box domain-containing protein n=1 Tax=Kwoniella bestiolae CBS 10118 TaxID=1296100 RepID=A0A1B9G2C2_9TREE|nr:hypothetical protein I302_04981 [Kwoniella bestiolae CBS 10118]OCF25170.1 hypothetical protein I302_04981 [Kwoniella bestiolae CBS 10118]